MVGDDLEINAYNAIVNPRGSKLWWRPTYQQ
jgi:hypothetical protein